ncbi:MAG: effector binding domain-containing protein [Candidatus Cohnella colombiensis]|uniref:Effector binding domain-containing protein n=1 Tax=Candidatus Cohnella colombiensis TaxID=3121368 RepID=A0AA95EX90_9BACL|nr:MAG: effector binding domain-containing protein [Cohnella sp.]
MEWLKQMQSALDLIENSMEERIGIEEIARAATSSPFHFQRMFHMVTGMTVGEYMRKRRLTLAAQELVMSSTKVLDVALKYGYDSPESFAKAFRKIHGIAPSQARMVGVNLKAFPRITFQLTLKGDQDMNYQIVEKEAFIVAGKAIQTTCEDGQNLRDITRFWEESHRNGLVNRLCSVISDRNVLGVITGMELGDETFTYLIAGRTETTDIPDEFVLMTIPAANWAIFTSVGPMPGAIQRLFNRIYQEWFPATGYEHAGTPELEVYPPGDTTAEDYRCEVWIPIVKK